MDVASVDFGAARSAKARASVRLGGAVDRGLIVLAVVCVVAGVGLLVASFAVGWFVLGLAALPYMLHEWYQGELAVLASGKTMSITDRLSGDMLGRLPKNPTPRDVAAVAGDVIGGRFMALRFGLTKQILLDLSPEDPNTLPLLWQTAEAIRQEAGVERISGSVAGAAILRMHPQYEQIIAQMHLSDGDLVAGVRWQQHIHQLIADFKRPRRTGGIARDWSFGYTPLLSRFGRNLTQQVQHGNVAVNVASHTRAIDQLIDTFGSGGRQNAALVGPTGVGKTTIIEAFAARLLDASRPLPKSLKFRQVVMLDSSALIAAAPGRGELEQLIMSVLGEAFAAKNIIICLDNAQLFFEEGVGSVDLANVLQPILDAGRLRVILSLDEQRYLQIGQRNPALINVLNRVSVAPASEEETMMILQEQTLYTEAQRKVLFTYQALKESYRLSQRYVYDVAQPGQSIRLLDSAAGYAENGLVTMNSVQRAVEESTGVKVTVASEAADRERLLNLEQHIHERMINQTRAVQVVSDALRRARAGVRNQDRPIGTFLFLGPTGVGKTELSKALAEVYFGGEQNLIRLDLNEFVRSDDVVRLIADGADDPMSLTARVMKQPFSVILLDEIEKAAPEVLATLLQLLDEGILRDIKNREVSFRDAIIVATSNAGADRIREYIERGYDVTQFEQQFNDELISSGQFRPEFLNRFDEMVIFTPLSREHLRQVADLIIAGVNKTLEPQKVRIVVSDEAKQLLVEAGYDPRLGARPMRRVVQRAVENIVAKQMLEGTAVAGSEVVIDADQVRPLLAQPSSGVVQ